MQQHVQLLLPPPLNAPLALWEIFGHKLTSFRFVEQVAPKGATQGDEADEVIANGRDGSALRDAFVAEQGL